MGRQLGSGERLWGSLGDPSLRLKRKEWTNIELKGRKKEYR